MQYIICIWFAQYIHTRWWCLADGGTRFIRNGMVLVAAISFWQACRKGRSRTSSCASGTKDILLRV